MKIFGINFETKKELRQKNVELMDEIEELIEEIDFMLEDFPFFIGQTVYDVALKNAKGRYTKVNPSLEHSTITAVTVDEKNYFSLVNRYEKNDVFIEREEAESYLRQICRG